MGASPVPYRGKALGRIVAFLLMIAVFLPVFAGEHGQATPRQQAYRFWEQGYLLHLFGAYVDAISMFEKSIGIHPTAEGHTYLGWSMSKLGRLEEAIDQCKMAISLDPDYGNPYNDIGVYLIDLGRPAEAAPWLEKAMAAKRYCCYQFPHANLGRVLLGQGRMAEAERAFERALAYDPDYAPALLGLKYIRDQGFESL